MVNHLEQLVGEWLEYRGFFVRRNVKVKPRDQGGYDGELDILALHPKMHRLLHVETSMDTESWSQREVKFERKFRLGAEAIPSILDGLKLPSEVEHIALLAYASDMTRDTIGGGRIVTLDKFLQEVFEDLANKDIKRAIVSEVYPLLRTLQYAWSHSKTEPPANWLNYRLAT